MTCEIIIFTHSDYNDIWPIVCDSLQQIPMQIKTSFAVNSNAEVDRLQPWKVYTYDDTKPYASRLVEILQKVTSEYILFFHDVDILRSFDIERFSKLLDWVIKEDIDRFYLGVFGSNQYERNVADMPVGKSGINICEWFTTPYDVGPSIWKRNTFLELMMECHTETYRSIESSNIQQILAKKRVYGFCKMNIPVRFTVGRPFTEWFSFCHILVRGKWIPYQAFQSYHDFFVEIPEKYNIDIGKRGVTEFYHGMLLGFKIS